MEPREIRKYMYFLRWKWNHKLRKEANFLKDWKVHIMKNLHCI
jgi:hypothetical protein